MQPNEPNEPTDREGRDPAEAQPPAQEVAAEADAIGYDDPSVSPLDARRAAQEHGDAERG